MKKGITITLIILIILIISGFFVYRYFFAPRIISENSYPVLSCSDTDGKDIYVKGYTNYERDEPGESSRYESPDTCESHPKAGNVLRESWCEGNTYKEIRVTCGIGSNCVNGRCI